MKERPFPTLNLISAVQNRKSLAYPSIIVMKRKTNLKDMLYVCRVQYR